MPIILKPLGGLGSRLRAIGSAVALGRALGTSVKVLWERDSTLQSPFQSLFEPGDFEVEEHGGLGKFVHDLTEPRYSRRILNGHIASKSAEELRHLLLALPRDESLYFKTRYEFFPMPNGLLASLFLPVPELRQRVEYAASRFPEPIVGLHVRRRGHHPDRRLSPLWLYKEHLERELEKTPRARFLLTTDCPLAERDLRQAYPQHILSPPRVYGRDTVAGMRAAVCDLFLLARTKKILGAYGSSFPVAASHLYGAPLTVLRTVL
jgi:hypothetical protein